MHCTSSFLTGLFFLQEDKIEGYADDSTFVAALLSSAFERVSAAESQILEFNSVNNFDTLALWNELNAS